MMAAGAQVLRLLVFAIGAIFRPKALLIAENLCLRQQLVVLQAVRSSDGGHTATVRHSSQLLQQPHRVNMKLRYRPQCL